MNTFKVLLFIGLALGSSSGQYMTRPVNNGFNSQPVPTQVNSAFSGFNTPQTAPAARPQVQQVQQFFSAPTAPAAQQTSFLPAAAPCSRPHTEDSNQQQGTPSQSGFPASSNIQQQQYYGTAPAADVAPVAQIAAAPAPLQMFAPQSAPAQQTSSGYSAPAAQIAPAAQQSADQGYGSAPAQQTVQTFGVQSAQMSFSAQPTFTQQSFSSRPIAPADSSAQFNAPACTNNGPSADINTAITQQIQPAPQQTQQFVSVPQQPQQFQSAPQQSQQVQSVPQQLYTAPAAPVAQAAPQQQAAFSAPAQRPY